MKDREAWCAANYGVTKSWTQLSDRTTTKATHTHISDRALLNIPNLRACLPENVTMCFVKGQTVICLQGDVSRTSFCLTQPDRWTHYITASCLPFPSINHDTEIPLGMYPVILSKLQEVVKDRGAWHAAVSGVSKS